MRILVFGGTLFLGRHVVEAARERGHEVTVFNRGRTDADAFPEVERLHGDRDAGELDALRGRTWDVAIDVPARKPSWVREATTVLAEAVEHYTFVSSCSVYADHSRAADESAAVEQLPPDADESDLELYGALKAECERIVESALPGRVLSVRAGLIVGPHDPTGRFTYWPHRIARGGEVLAPEPRVQPVQIVHARDLADWIVAMAERRRTGALNAVGPDRRLTMEELLEACVATVGSGSRLTWVGEDFLRENGVEPWSDLPLWLAPNTDPAFAGFLSVDVSRALESGLRFRPLEQTIADTLAGAPTTPEAGLSPEREAELLRAWRARAATRARGESSARPA